MSPWNKETIQANREVRASPSTTSVLRSNQNLRSRLFGIDVNAGLQGSFLAGLLEVSGAASYASNEKSRADIISLVLNYKVKVLKGFVIPD